MKSTTSARRLNLAAKALRTGLFEDTKIQTKLDNKELVRQIVTDIAKESTAPVASLNVASLAGGATHATVIIGVPGGEDGVEAGVRLEIAIGGTTVKFMINGKHICQCNSDLTDYDVCLTKVQKALGVARIAATDATGARSSTPNYGQMMKSRVGRY